MIEVSKFIGKKEEMFELGKRKTNNIIALEISGIKVKYIIHYKKSLDQRSINSNLLIFSIRLGLINRLRARYSIQ